MPRSPHQLRTGRLFGGAKVCVTQRRSERTAVIPGGDLHTARARLADVCKMIGRQVVDDEIPKVALKRRHRHAGVPAEETVVADLRAAAPLRVQIGVAKERKVQLADLRRSESLPVSDTNLVALARPGDGHARRCFAAKRVVMIAARADGQLERSARQPVFEKKRVAGAMMWRNVEAEAVSILRFTLLSLDPDDDHPDTGLSSRAKVDVAARRGGRAERLRIRIFIVIVAMILGEPQLRMHTADFCEDRKGELPLLPVLPVMGCEYIRGGESVRISRDAEVVVRQTACEADR